MVMDFLQRRPSSFPRPRIGGGARTAISMVKQGDLKGVNKRCALFTQ